MKNSTQSRNPFSSQIRYPVLARASDSRVTPNYIDTNHRFIRKLVLAPSQFIYHNCMQVLAGKDMFPDSAKSIIAIMRGIYLGLNKRDTTLVVSLKGS